MKNIFLTRNKNTLQITVKVVLLLAVIYVLATKSANAQLDKLFDESGKYELHTFGSDVIVDSGGAAWHDESNGLANDGRTFVYYDIDDVLGVAGNAATFNSSSVDYTLAAGKNIIKAFLVWGAKVDNDFNDASGVQEQVRLYVNNTTNVPSGSYVSISSDGGGYFGPIGGGGAAFDVYGYHADVTQYFSGLAPGNTFKIMVADIEARLDDDILGGGAAGWALHLILENPALDDSYYISVYGGMQVVNPNSTVDFAISGLDVPAFTAGETYITTSGLDGDRVPKDFYSFGINAGSLERLSDSKHFDDNFFNAGRTFNGEFYDATPGPIAASSPNYDKVTHDVIQLTPNAAFNLPAGTTSALARLRTLASEGVNITSFAIATPDLRPELIVEKTASASGNVETGENLTYTIDIENTGQVFADIVIITDNLPAGITYVAGTTEAVITKVEGSYLDQFTNRTYNNSDGSMPWTSSWVETEDGAAGPTAGDIQVNTDGTLRLQDIDTGEGIERTVDLSVADPGQQVKLTWTFNRINGDKTIRVELKVNGSWVNVDDSGGADNGSVSHILTSAQVTGTTAVRFIKDSDNWGNNERIDIDNVQFSFTRTTTGTVSFDNIANNGITDLASGVPPTLITASDNIGLYPDEQLTITFDVEVDACNVTLNNIATATAIGMLAPSTGSVEIYGVDIEDPTITCPQNVSVANDAGVCGASLTLDNPGYSDNCNVTLLTWSTTGATELNSASTGINTLGTQFFNPGVTTVTYHAEDAAGNSAECSFTVTVEPCADLSLTKIVSNATPNIGDVITFTITVNNSGPSSATGVQVEDIMPDGLINISGATAVGSYNVNTGLWDLGASYELLSGSYVELVITATAGPNCGTISNIAQIKQSDIYDPDSTPGQ